METNNISANESSGVNTIILVIILVLLVGFGVWWFTRTPEPAEPNTPGINLDVTIPGTSDGGTPAPSPTPSPSPAY